ncbi:hypothetical protein [Nocardia sp. CNY236]|uniref:hypothetical protein n=1 Tax=Nocardia sp. CNY236 TaxID=1169152 RepID=UPI00048CCAE7|nr:hypothetical protein [Nocardia sp. CNY236]
MTQQSLGRADRRSVGRILGVIITELHGDIVNYSEQPDRMRSALGWLERYGLSTSGLHAADRSEAENALAGIERRDAASGFELLRRIVRAAAIASISEAEFVRRLRTPGVMLQPLTNMAGSMIVGYRLRDPRIAPLGPEIFDGDLGLDCRLDELRLEWDHSEQAHLEATAEWRQTRVVSDLQRRESVLLTSPVMWRRALVDATQFTDWLWQVDAFDHQAWRWAATRLAGVLSIWSLRVEGTSVGPIASASHELARGGLQPGSRRRPFGEGQGPSLSHTAYVLAQQAATAGDPVCESLLLTKLNSAMVSIAKAHRRRGELPVAMKLMGTVLTALREVERELRMQTQLLEREKPTDT